MNNPWVTIFVQLALAGGGSFSGGACQKHSNVPKMENSEQMSQWLRDDRIRNLKIDEVRIYSFPDKNYQAWTTLNATRPIQTFLTKEEIQGFCSELFVGREEWREKNGGGGLPSGPNADYFHILFADYAGRKYEYLRVKLYRKFGSGIAVVSSNTGSGAIHGDTKLAQRLIHLTEDNEVNEN